jgi:hypothetical protein
VLDEVLATWAESYGDQTENDHAALINAIRRGTVEVQKG